jgi:hypothetical protein
LIRIWLIWLSHIISRRKTSLILEGGKSSSEHNLWRIDPTYLGHILAWFSMLETKGLWKLYHIQLILRTLYEVASQDLLKEYEQKISNSPNR